MIKVKVHVKSKKSEVIVRNNIFDVYTNMPPLAGQANKEVINLLTKFLRIKKNQIFLNSGEKSKIKIFEIIEN